MFLTGNLSKRKSGRGPTTNIKLAKKKAKGEPLDVQFPAPFYKVCGKHAKLFKSEVTNCIRQHAQLQVIKWKQVPEEDKKIIWTILKVYMMLISFFYFMRINTNLYTLLIKF